MNRIWRYCVPELLFCLPITRFLREVSNVEQPSQSQACDHYWQGYKQYPKQAIPIVIKPDEVSERRRVSLTELSEAVDVILANLSIPETG
jgi:hypothetical protein